MNLRAEDGTEARTAVARLHPTDNKKAENMKIALKS